VLAVCWCWRFVNNNPFPPMIQVCSWKERYRERGGD
jgi:hypothetical protein